MRRRPQVKMWSERSVDFDIICLILTLKDFIKLAFVYGHKITWLKPPPPPPPTPELSPAVSSIHSRFDRQ